MASINGNAAVTGRGAQDFAVSLDGDCTRRFTSTSRELQVGRLRRLGVLPATAAALAELAFPVAERVAA
jgi:hypothetical protein